MKARYWLDHQDGIQVKGYSVQQPKPAVKAPLIIQDVYGRTFRFPFEQTKSWMASSPRDSLLIADTHIGHAGNPDSAVYRGSNATQQIRREKIQSDDDLRTDNSAAVLGYDDRTRDED
jgi:hypothetical protein